MVYFNVCQEIDLDNLLSRLLYDLLLLSAAFFVVDNSVTVEVGAYLPLLLFDFKQEIIRCVHDQFEFVSYNSFMGI